MVFHWFHSGTNIHFSGNVFMLEIVYTGYGSVIGQQPKKRSVSLVFLASPSFAMTSHGLGLHLLLGADSVLHLLLGACFDFGFTLAFRCLL